MFGSAEEISIVHFLLLIVRDGAALHGQHGLSNDYPKLIRIIYIYWAMTVRIPCKSLLIG
jgi:hypothetical protein